MSDFDITPLLSTFAKATTQPKLFGLVRRFAGSQDVIGMHGGLPPPKLFPMTAMNISCIDPTRDGWTEVSEGGTHDPALTMQISIDTPEAMTKMQQYSLSVVGHASLVEWLRNLIYRMQSPARADLEVILTPGCTASLNGIMRMLLDPGDCALVEESMFTQPYEACIRPAGVTAIPVAMDEEGISPEALQAAVDAAPKPPKLLYCVPHCQNPTGGHMSLARKKAIYTICCAHNICIVEDDPYIYLQFPSDPSQGVPGLDVEPGFLSLDSEGRVIRVDTFSKILAPGLRLAWVTAAPKVIKHATSACFGSTFGPACTSQGIVHAMLSEWGMEGFEKVLKGIQRTYQSRAVSLASALRSHCGGRTVVRPPTGGMFLWVEIPGLEDSEELLDDMVKHDVVVVPGRYFSVRCSEESYKCKFVRMAYSSFTEDRLEEGAKRFAAVLEEYAKRTGKTL